MGDLDGDGRLDVATANYAAATVSVLLNDGSGTLRARLDYRVGRRPRSVAIADLNADGKPDLAAANARVSNLRAPEQWRRAPSGPGEISEQDTFQ